MQRKSTEPVEQRDLAERNSACPPVFGTQRPVKSESGLSRVRQTATFERLTRSRSRMR